MTDFGALFGALAKSGVEYVLVGGVAATVHGSTRLTQDVDVVYRRTDENLDRLERALAPVHPYPRGAPPGLPFEWSSETLKRGLNFTLTTDVGFIDLLGEIVGGGRFEGLAGRSEPVELFGHEVLCVGLDALIFVKRAAGRPKDYEAIAELEALREERTERRTEQGTDERIEPQTDRGTEDRTEPRDEQRTEPRSEPRREQKNGS